MLQFRLTFSNGFYTILRWERPHHDCGCSGATGDERDDKRYSGYYPVGTYDCDDPQAVAELVVQLNYPTMARVPPIDYLRAGQHRDCHKRASK